MKQNKTIITGVDNNLVDLLPWWVNNVRKHHGKKVDITIADFGVTPAWNKWMKQNADRVLEYPQHKKCAWFYKPHTLIQAPYEYKRWVDIDCEVIADISDIFDYVDGTNIGLTDDPCRTREPGDSNTKWFATGVVAVKDIPRILKIWNRWCLPRQNGIKKHVGRGDQEILHKLLSTGNLHESVVELPMIYQWLRIQLAKGQDNPNKKIIHWTGPYGKSYIRSKISFDNASAEYKNNLN